MEVLLAGNTGYVTETFIEESFPECDVVVLGNEMLKSNRKKNILSRPFIKDEKELKEIFETYEFERIVYFSNYLTMHGRMTGELEQLRQILQLCKKNKEIRMLYLTGQERKIAEIEPKDVIAWQNHLLAFKRANGKGYSASYLRKIHSQLSAIFNHAVDFYHLPSNPAQKAGNIAIEEYKEMLFWTKEEYLKFADVMMDKPVSYYAFEMLYWCGIREGELLALTPADFDFTTHTLRINKSYQRLNREDVITPPKTFKSNRFIKMPQFICDEMQDYMGMLYGLKEDERIFTISKSYLHHEMNRGSKVSGVKRIRVHDLRHSHVSLLINMGFTVLAIADRMGHESIDITYRYAHLFPSEQTQMAEQLDIERMEKLNGEKSGQ